MLALLDRLYRRHRRGYFWGLLGLLALETEIAATVAMFLGCVRYEGLSFSQFLTQLLWSEIPVMGLFAFGIWCIRKEIRIIVRWGRNEPVSPQAVAEALQRAVRGPLIGGLAEVLIEQPVASYLCVAPTHHVTAARYFPILIGASFGLAYGILMVLLTFETGRRPMLVELAKFEPAVNRIVQRPARIATRLIVGLFASCGITAIFVGGVVQDPGRGVDRVLIAILVSLPFVAIVLVPLAAMVLDPVRALLGGTNAVAEGDLGTVVPLLSTDELGVLVDSFNGMMDGLRERESLRGRNRELDSALQASRARIVATADAERRRLERDIHDGAQQRLVTMNLKLGMLRRQLVDDPVRAAATADELCGDAKLALAELRDLAHGIYPAVLENEGLTVALEDAGRRAAGVSVRVVSEDRERYSSEIEAAVYFCCLEALTNASKHAGEDAKVTLAISPVRDRLNFSITDDGPGFDSRSTKSHGLDNMSDRIGAVGGELVIRSSPGSGTTVRGWVPRTLAALPT